MPGYSRGVFRSITLGYTVAALAATVLAPASAAAQRIATVSGKVVLLDKGNRPATDVGQAVVWLESARPAAPAPVAAQIVAADKEFRPRVVVVTVGSQVAFPNGDPFDHNVFSLSEEGPFDLGLYSRGVTKSMQFKRPGIIRVYCNVHAQMSAFVVVRDSPYYAQPGADGAFTMAGVPPGVYTLRAWHERAAEFSPRAVEVTAAGLSALDVRLDARGYKFVQHLNKFGQPYPTRGRRY
jgi:plastocyanin